MTLRDLISVFPCDESKAVELIYFDKDSNDTMGMDLYCNFEQPDDDDLYGNIMLEHFADDDVLEIKVVFSRLRIVMDRRVSKATVERWKDFANTQADLFNRIKTPERRQEFKEVICR